MDPEPTKTDPPEPVETEFPQPLWKNIQIFGCLTPIVAVILIAVAVVCTIS